MPGGIPTASLRLNWGARASPLSVCSASVLQTVRAINMQAGESSKWTYLYKLGKIPLKLKSAAVDECLLRGINYRDTEPYYPFLELGYSAVLETKNRGRLTWDTRIVCSSYGAVGNSVEIDLGSYDNDLHDYTNAVNWLCLLKELVFIWYPDSAYLSTPESEELTSQLGAANVGWLAYVSNSCNRGRARSIDRSLNATEVADGVLYDVLPAALLHPGLNDFSRLAALAKSFRQMEHG